MIPSSTNQTSTTSTQAATSAMYRFTRDERSPTGFQSSQRPSTDAMNVIGKWEAAGNGRSYDVVDDQDEHLVAKLTFPTADVDHAAQDFNALCAQFGVKYEVVTA